MDDHAMTDRDIVADCHGHARIDMDYRIVLDVASRPHRDLIIISPKDGTKPDAGTGAKADGANHVRTGSNVNIFSQLRNLVSKLIDHGSASG